MNYRNLIASTAIISVMAGFAFAQDATTKIQATDAQAATRMENAAAHSDMRWLSSQLTGKPVYASSNSELDAIGEINDLVVLPNGTVVAVIVGVGGFLGVGEKDVELSFSDLTIEVKDDGDVRLTVPMTKEALTEAEAFDREALLVKQPDRTATAQQTSAASDTNTANPAIATSKSVQALPESNSTAKQNASVSAEMKTAMPADTISAEKLIGISVYDRKEQKVGEVGDVVLAKSGDVDVVIVDVGGFLGIGEKPVAIGFDQLMIKRINGNDLQLMSAISKEKFESATAFKQDEYEARRGEMRVISE